MNKITVTGITLPTYEEWKSLVDDMSGLNIEIYKGAVPGTVTCGLTYDENSVTLSIRRTSMNVVIEFESDDMVTILDATSDDFEAIHIS